MGGQRPTERPMRADARRNRARVLETAENVFLEQGLSVPIDEIARRAGVGIGTVYRHFPTKDALYEAIVVDRVQWLVEHAQTLGSSDTPGDGFFRYVRDMVELAAVNKNLYEALAADNDTKQQLAKLAEELKQALQVLLTRAQQAGAVRHDLTVVDVKGLIAGAQVAIRYGAAADRTADVICAGLRPQA